MRSAASPTADSSVWDAHPLPAATGVLRGTDEEGARAEGRAGGADFLPFTCDGCGLKHCAAHRTYAEHHCASPKTEPVRGHGTSTGANVTPCVRLLTCAFAREGMQVRAAPCPVCSQVIAAGKDESLDARMDTHLRLGCAAEAAQRRQRKEKNMCSHPKCHKTELLPFHCRDCGQSYCLRYALAYLSRSRPVALIATRALTHGWASWSLGWASWSAGRPGTV